ncbi:MAG: SsrA-binding protein SmpB [Thermaerobacter sp.]|nr:SsrA-binding protein SmpB [Thermaerobacter sp.]
MKIIADNRKARHDYFVLETIEAGIALTGTEVKSARLGRVNLQDAYASMSHGEIFLQHVHISPYDQGNRMNHEPYRRRKLLLHRRELDGLVGRMRERGMTIVPLRMYFNDRGFCKVELGVCRGKKLYDKREDLKTRDAKREMERALKSRR